MIIHASTEMKQSFVGKHNVCGDCLSIIYSTKVPVTKLIPASRSVLQSLCTTIDLKGSRVKETAILQLVLVLQMHFCCVGLMNDLLVSLQFSMNFV